ncbi:Nuclear pore complex protein like [Actinidia chinensis var. chinensis]|uniref:Nuclear pore complex protein like n=1 Tax=Actinidia chinensis var. chinensis TaxID=1590841 RepID=A0A2R6PRJ4_ACTCC|nr:Nuclear pore complex protein like [Actinidia chinensis var. chinensis]
MLRSQHLLSSHFNFPCPLSHPRNSPLSFHSSPFFLYFLHRPTHLQTHLRTRPEPWLARVAEPTTTTTTTTIADDGPIELPPSMPSIFATSDDPSSIQVATSVLLTGAISVFLFRSLRRRAKRVKELKFRSSGAKKSLKEEAMESLKAMTPAAADAKGPPSALQTLLGGISAGVIALILYKFTTTIESALNRQTISDNFSVRQITITIRTIVNGICYLATCVFGINSIGLFLYSAQLAFSSLMEDSSKGTENEDEAQMTTKSPSDGYDMSISNEDQSSDSTP